MPAESKTLTSCGEPTSLGPQGATITNGATGYIGDIITTTGNGFITIPDYTITTTPYIANPTPYIANPGWVSGTTSIGTIASYPKDGTIRMDPDTNEFSIYLAESNEWVPCEVEEIRKEKDEDGKIKNIITVSFGCSVTQMKKKQRERFVMFEKVKKYDLNSIWSSSIGTSFIGYHTTGTFNTALGYNALVAGGMNNIAIGSITPITINTGGIGTCGGFTQTTTTGVSPGQIYYNTNNYTTNIVIDNIGTSIQIS
jgi:hypothetical protein